MPRQIRVLREATFSDRAPRYRVTSGVVQFLTSIFGIPFLVVAYPILRWYYPKYYARLKVTLTARELIVIRGVLNREEKNIPLEKITDVALLEGLIMRRFRVKGLRVETAGQVGGQMGLVNIIGIEDPEAFRDAILEQRDRVSDEGGEGPPRVATSATSSEPPADSVALLTQIRDHVARIEARIGGRG